MNNSWYLMFVLAVFSVIATSCANSGPTGVGTTPVLAGTSWSILEVAGQDVIDSGKTTLQFDENLGVRGYSGCNRFTGSATIEGSTIKFSPFASTRRACKQDLMKQEKLLSSAFSEAQTFILGEQDALQFLDLNGMPVLKLIAYSDDAAER